jgi:protein involved in polysaccharide export with SLBB domain
MWLSMAVSYAQVPIPLQEQIETFGALSTAQQQALIRELQRELPPAQRDAVLGMLRQQQGGSAPVEGGSVPTVTQRTASRNEEIDFGAEGRFEPNDTLIIEFLWEPDPQSPLSADDRDGILQAQERFASGNPYQLDAQGRLYVPGIPAFALAGLDVDQATVRIQSERTLRDFDIVLTRLPLELTGTDALKPFGYDLFFGIPSTFAPATDIPVPADYVIGPGDTVNVQLFGNQNSEYFLAVNREGSINFPEIGPLSVSGLTISELRTTITERVNEQMIGVRASTTLGELRSIRVFVLGDVEQAGSYTVSGLSTMTNALLASGGIAPIGSLRRVALMRNGETVSTLDLYDLLLKGDTSADARLQPGDAIFVPPVGPTVTVDGEVRRPAIYEVRGEQTVAQFIELAGGLTSNASPTAVKLERIVAGAGTAVRDIDLVAATQSLDGIRDGDVIRVQPNLERLEGSVRLEGNVFRPGLYQWSPGMTIADLLPSPEFVKPISDLNYVLVRRENAPNVDIDVLSVDLDAVWQRRPGARNLALQARDTVYVFSLEIGRAHIVNPLLAELRAQLETNEPLPTVTVAGQVRASGTYPLEPGMRVMDLLRAGGGMTPSAYGIEAELTRYEVVSGEFRQAQLVNVDLASISSGAAANNLVLRPYDMLTVKEVPRWTRDLSISVEGEVQFPGVYVIRPGETLSSVLERAGGITDLAFPEGSVFTRVALREREAEQLDVLARRIETDLASVALADPGSRDVIVTGQTLVDQLRNTTAVGRLVIDLNSVLSGVADRDILLRSGDALFVPEITQEVMVLGEVQNSTSHLYTVGLNKEDYIDLSGGMTNRADKKRVYVVRANGSVFAGSRASWFRRSGRTDLQPGDTIVVPLDTDRVRPLTAWESITQILYNIAVAFSVIDRI